MRIVCPNCAAEYEVDAALIPDSGRDVQCSSCGHAWFVPHPEQFAAEESEQSLYDPPNSRDDESATEPVMPPARPVDQAVLDFLREEAAHEAAQRQAETRSGFDSQPDFDPIVSPGTQAKVETAHGESTELAASAVAERIARLKGQASVVTAAEKTHATHDSGPAKRSELLPEIDEINSSLRPAAEKRPGAAAAVARTMPAKGGFSRGFLFALLIWVILITVYLLAPQLSARIPAIAPGMEAYVSFVDGIRTALAEMGGRLIEMVGQITG